MKNGFFNTALKDLFIDSFVMPRLAITTGGMTSLPLIRELTRYILDKFLDQHFDELQRFFNFAEILQAYAKGFSDYQQPLEDLRALDQAEVPEDDPRVKEAREELRKAARLIVRGNRPV